MSHDASTVLAYLAMLPGPTPGSDELVRRLALWLLREALLSWVSLRPQDTAPFCWLIHVLRLAVTPTQVSPHHRHTHLTYSHRAVCRAIVGVWFTFLLLSLRWLSRVWLVVQDRDPMPDWLRDCVVQELRLLLAQVGSLPFTPLSQPAQPYLSSLSCPPLPLGLSLSLLHVPAASGAGPVPRGHHRPPGGAAQPTRRPGHHHPDPLQPCRRN